MKNRKLWLYNSKNADMSNVLHILIMHTSSLVSILILNIYGYKVSNKKKKDDKSLKKKTRKN